MLCIHGFVCVRRYYMRLPTMHSNYTSIPSSISQEPRNSEQFLVSPALTQALVSLAVRRATAWSTTLWGTRSGWAPASPKTSTCRPPGAQPACSAPSRAARATSSSCASEATTPVKKSPWSWGRSCCKCVFISPQFLSLPEGAVFRFTYASQTGDSLLACKVPGGSWFQIAAH